MTLKVYYNKCRRVQDMLFGKRSVFLDYGDGWVSLSIFSADGSTSHPFTGYQSLGKDFNKDKWQDVEDYLNSEGL